MREMIESARAWVRGALVAVSAIAAIGGGDAIPQRAVASVIQQSVVGLISSRSDYYVSPFSGQRISNAAMRAVW